MSANSQEDLFEVIETRAEEVELLIAGKDELNLAEFPLSTLSKRCDPDAKKLHFEDSIWDSGTQSEVNRRLTILASDHYGLPTAMDDEVILALIQLSKMQGFRSKQVTFTRYQIIKVLGWQDKGDNYRRIDESIERWLSVTLKYENAWWNRAEQTWMDESFHILERVTTPRNDKGEKTHAFVWNDVVYTNFRNGNLKDLNLGVFRALQTPLAKRLYRLLDKRFFHRRTVEFDVKNLCYNKLGMSRNAKSIGTLKQRLASGIAELENNGIIEPLPAKERYRKLRVGEWVIRFDKVSKEQKDLGTVEPLILSEGEASLIERGVNAKQAKRLVLDHTPEHIRAKVEMLDYLMTKEAAERPKNPAGWVVSAITEDFTAPTGFVSQEERLEKERAERDRKEKRNSERRAKEEAKREAASERERERQETEEKVSNYLNSLSAGERERIVEESVAPFIELCQAMGEDSEFWQVCKRQAIEKHVMKLIRDESDRT